MDDIRPLKQRLRERAKEYRLSMPEEEKKRADSKITERLLNMWSYRDASLILIYVSTAIEVDTRGIISKALEAGKRVAVPLCDAKNRTMSFRYINSFSQLEEGYFGVLEPNPEECEEVSDYSAALCIVPALMFDSNGCRLGYGKGFYDRFLSSFGGESIGLCYSAGFTESLPRGKYDRKINLFVTESRIYLSSR